jgi:Ser/Thr protein kinase RdoA (MazF antagonist)
VALCAVGTAAAWVGDHTEWVTLTLSSFLGTDALSRLHGGYQSQVYTAVADDGRPCVAKLRGTTGIDRGTLVTQMLMVANLAAFDPRVCSPLVRDGSYVLDVDIDGTTKFGTLFELAEGQVPNDVSSTDAQLMGAELSKLHGSLQSLPEYDIPLVPALAAVGFEPGGAPLQLIHGDYSSQNLRKADGSVLIFDFDDCGYGTREFDVANSLYMVLFDAVVNDTNNGYRDFEEAFVDGYITNSTETPFDRESLPTFIDMRVNALETWLAEPRVAPVGIRTATPQWRHTLGQFTEQYWKQVRP